MGLWSSVNCSETMGSIKEDFDFEGGIDCSVELHTAWGTRYDLIYDIVGNQKEWPYPVTGHVKPLARKASITPMPTEYTTVDGQNIVYIVAVVTIKYSTKITELFSESIEPTAEFRTLDWKRFRWGSKAGDPLKDGEAPGQQVKGLNFVRTIMKVEPPLPPELLELYGCCNESAYTSEMLGLTFDEETLLFQAPGLSRSINVTGDLRYNMVLKWSVRPKGWNKYYRQKSEEYEEIFDAESDDPFKSYPPKDFSAFLP